MTNPVTEGTNLVTHEGSLTFRLCRKSGKRKIGGLRTGWGKGKGGDYEDDDDDEEE